VLAKKRRQERASNQKTYHGKNLDADCIKHVRTQRGLLWLGQSMSWDTGRDEAEKAGRT
jgi:hypothetical protein